MIRLSLRFLATAANANTRKDFEMIVVGQIPVPFPDKMPDTAAQAIIWIAIACIAGLIASMTFGVRWLLGYMNNMRDDTKELAGKFEKESQSQRETFQSHSDANRQVFSESLNTILESHKVTQEKSLVAFDRHIERLSAAIEGKIRNERKSGSA